MLTAFFSYNTSEALLMSPEQRQSIVGILEQIRRELQQEEDEHTLRIVTSQIEQLLELVSRYYALPLELVRLPRKNSPHRPRPRTPTC